jgi:hypothetical protein
MAGKAPDAYRLLPDLTFFVMAGFRPGHPRLPLEGSKGVDTRDI